MGKVLFFLGLLIAQIVVVGLVIVLSFSFASLISLFSRGSAAFFIVDILLLILAILAVPIISAIWTYRDVKRFVSFGVDAWVPAGWALVMLFFWFPGLTIYLFLRKFRYKIELKGRN